MEVFGLSAAQIDLVAIVSNDVGVDYTLLKKHDWTVQDYIFENENFGNQNSTKISSRI